MQQATMNSPELATGWRQTTHHLFLATARVLAAVLVITTCLTLLAEHHWLADLFANLRVQQCLALLPASLIFIACRRWRWLTVTGVCLAIHLPWFSVAMPQSTETQTSSQRLTVTLVNILTSNQRHEQIVADVLSRSPDLFVILELSDSMAAKLDAEVKPTYRHCIVRSMDDGNFGIGLYSRHPIEESDAFTLNTEIESISAKVRVDGRSYRIFATHPLPPMGDRRYRLRNEHLQKLASIVRDAAADTAVPTILVGDLNLTPWSPHFTALEDESGLHLAKKDFHVTPTWYRYPIFPFGLMLDHALISDELVCTEHIVGPDIGSDHRSVTVTLAFAGQSTHAP